MDPRQLCIDERLRLGCVYCGGEPDTRDHVPSKILLDEPFPASLPVVPACRECNQSFSLDEEYLSCLLEVVLKGSVDPHELEHARVRDILTRKPNLADRLLDAKHVDENGEITWQPELERVQNVLLKLARGHVAYELNQSRTESPNSVTAIPLALFSVSDRGQFERGLVDEISGWPEIGCRAFYRACGVPPDPHQDGNWIVVQEHQYRYMVFETSSVVVRIVLREYLACEVVWDIA